MPGFRLVFNRFDRKVGDTLCAAISYLQTQFALIRWTLTQGIFSTSCHDGPCCIQSSRTTWHHQNFTFLASSCPQTLFCTMPHAPRIGATTARIDWTLCFSSLFQSYFHHEEPDDQTRAGRSTTTYCHAMGLIVLCFGVGLSYKVSHTDSKGHVSGLECSWVRSYESWQVHSLPVQSCFGYDRLFLVSLRSSSVDQQPLDCRHCEGALHVSGHVRQ